MRWTRGLALAAAGLTGVAGVGLAATTAAVAAPHGHSSFIGRFHHTSMVASTVPANGDVNPYGIVVVRHSQGRLHRGDITDGSPHGCNPVAATTTPAAHQPRTDSHGDACARRLRAHSLWA